MLRIVADRNIVAAEEAFGPLGELTLLPADAITPVTVRDADVLLVRSVTRVDQRFARLPRLRFVGTATIGTDHMDGAALRAAGIAVHHAPGSNADSVVEYVLCALLQLAAARGEPLAGRTVGIIGCGNIGSRLARRLPAFGCRVLLNDPPLAERAAREHRAHEYVALEHVFTSSDVVSLHVPFTREPPHPTHHLVSHEQLALLKPHAWLLNTSRGDVVDNAALLAALERGALAAAVLDVWEHEPRLDRALLRRAAIATPHIAGHSFDGKLNGTLMLYQALLRELGVRGEWNAEHAAAPAPEDRLALSADDVACEARADDLQWLAALARRLYDIREDDLRMREALLGLPAAVLPDAFQELRRRYPRRRSFNRFTIDAHAVPHRLHEPVQDGLMVRLRGD